MAPTKRPRGYNTEEVGELNPLNNNEIPNPEHLILKVALSTSSHTLSLSHPDPHFRLIADIKIFHSPYPNSDVTISTGRSALDCNWAFRLGAFHLVGVPGPVEEGPRLLTQKSCARFSVQDRKNKDLLRTPEFGWMRFITIPAAGSTRVELPLPLDRILQTTAHVKVEDLKPGMRYRVWMDQGLLGSVGCYSYWGSLTGDLKEKKLSSYRAAVGAQGEADYCGYLAEVIAGDDWAIERPYGPTMRGNVGRFGPVFDNGLCDQFTTSHYYGLILHQWNAQERRDGPWTCRVEANLVDICTDTLALSSRSALFRLFADIEILHSPRPGSAITVSTGWSDGFAFKRNTFHLLGVPGRVEPGPRLLRWYHSYRQWTLPERRNRDLLRDPELAWVTGKFLTVPPFGSVRAEFSLPLEEIMRNSDTPPTEIGDLEAGMQYRVWMKQEVLRGIGDYVYWGDLAGELKGKKLSNYRVEEGVQPGADWAGYLAEVLAEDGWVLQGPLRPSVRGNVGRFGPVFEFVE
ncbi:hypothetical protein C8R46DRAFT_1322692 [Mycena filopes]|nr:hypothetical protein C8R46DRAFT_1322692 [Mycena filopes]